MATTLVTFLFDCPVAARTVEILGSWDNFEKPYHLKQDRRRSSRNWTGCFTFQDIICDGDPSNPSPKRNGALKVGGTYWYYYRVNDDEEHHNPCQPSTTLCPLLPGQRLNILEIPMESRTGNDTQSSDPFTRNPDDRYLTPIPPKPLPSPRLGDLCKEPYSVPMHPFEVPGSASHPVSGRLPSARFDRRTKSASTSPRQASGQVFGEMKEKVATSRRATPNSREWKTGRNIRELEIGEPVLISTTAEDLNLVSLPSAHTPRESPSLPVHVASHFKMFSPLGSHPVDSLRERNLGLTLPRAGEERVPRRPHSHSQTVATTSTKEPSGRVRANSADTRRTKFYNLTPNEPWVPSPKMPSHPAIELQPAPVLQRPSFNNEPLRESLNQRPVSRYGNQSPASGSVSNDKSLPPLPQYLVPAPLFACTSATSSPTLQEDEDQDMDGSENDSRPSTPIKRTGDISTWSTAFNSPTSDTCAIHSPTFSSLTSNSSQPGSPERFSDQFSTVDGTYERDYKFSAGDDERLAPPAVSMVPPILQLPRLSFGPNIAEVEIHRAESSPRRQVACFGYSESQGFNLFQQGTTLQPTTATKTPSSPGPIADRERVSSASDLEKLMSDFGFLGEAVH